MYIIAIVGSIGSGKTTLSSFLKEYGIPIYDTDIEAKKFLTNQDVKRQLYKQLGEKVFSENSLDNKINTTKLGRYIFQNIKNLQKLTNIIYPLVKKHLEIWIKQEQIKKPPYVIIESAVLIESGLSLLVDKTIGVTAPFKTCIERLSQSRPEWSVLDILNRKKLQYSNTFLKNKCEFWIENNENLSMNDFKKKAAKLHKIFLNFKLK